MYCMGSFRYMHMQCVEFNYLNVLFLFLTQLATPQMICSSCGRQETLCKWMK